MTYEYDADIDCAYIKVCDLSIAKTRAHSSRLLVDFTENDEVVGIELLYVSNGVDLMGLFSSEVEEMLKEHGVKIQ